MGTESSLQQTAARTYCCSDTQDQFDNDQQNYRITKNKKSKSKSKLKSKSKHKSQEKRYRLTIETFDGQNIEVTNTFSYNGAKNITSSTYKNAQNTLEYVSPYWSTVNEITTNDSKYYTKCAKLSTLIQSHITIPSNIQHDQNDHDNSWESVHSMAALCQQPLYNFLETIIDSIKYFPEYKTVNSEILETELMKASLKKLKRAQEKVDTNYNGNWLSLVDVCRSSIVHSNFKHLYFILLILAQFNRNCFGFKIVKIKNRYKKTTDQGWADITLLIKPCKGMKRNMDYDKNINVNCSEDEEKVLQSLQGDEDMDEYEQNDEVLPGHICEVQLIHRAMWEKRKHGLFGHKAYGLTRTADSEAIKAANQVGGQMMGNMVNNLIDGRGDVIGKIGANMVVKNNREEFGKGISDQLYM